MPTDDGESFDALWAPLLPVGRADSGGGYRRFSWSAADLECREWFAGEAARRGMDLETDGNGNLWAWRNHAAPGAAVVTGSHLDSVPAGGAYDGALGVVCAFAALDRLDRSGAPAAAPVGVVAFVEEEGARFGVPCLGSRLLCGAIAGERLGALRDGDGIGYVEAMRAAGADPSRLGADPVRLRRIKAYVEVHIEQGRALVHSDAAVGVGRGVHPHGRWRLSFQGRADHAGTTKLSDRQDPMLPFAQTVLAVRAAAAAHGVLATIGRVLVAPNGTNVIPSQLSAWLDVRGTDEASVRGLVDEVTDLARREADRDGIGVELVEESWSPRVDFDADLAARLAARLGGAPLLATGAGHDAGVLAAAGVPTAMLFVRNPTGVSHAPDEYAGRADCLAGVAALAEAIAELTAPSTSSVQFRTRKRPQEGA